MAVIETTMTLDPVKDAWMVDHLRSQPDWTIKKELTTAITFHQIWHGELLHMPINGMKEVSE